MYDIFFYEAFEEEQAAIKQCCPPSINAGYTWKTIQEAGHKTPPAPVISLRTQSIIPHEWAGRLSAILSRSAGYDHLARYKQETGADLQYGYLPIYCVQAVAEQAMLLWMALLRKLPRQTQQFQQFKRDGITGTECYGRTLAVFGVGNIGYRIAKTGEALGMNVLGVDINPSHNDIHYVSADEALTKAQVIVSAMNLTSENNNYFNYSRMCSVCKKPIFVNIARGELAHAVDLLKLLKEDKLGGIAMDVYNCESELSIMLRENRSSRENPEIGAIQELCTHDNVIATPHNAFNTREAVDRKASQSIEQIVHLKEHGSFLWAAPV